MSLFTRGDLELGLRLVVAELRRRGRPARLRIVGGAALALRYFERETTQDIDVAVDLSDEELAEISLSVAHAQGWNTDWLNRAAEKFVPSYGRSVDWITIYDADSVVIQIAPPEVLLAMKLRANRPGRDDDDIKKLMAICRLTTLDDLEDLFAQFYPGDALSDRAIRMVEFILDAGLDAAPPPTPTLRLGSTHEKPPILGGLGDAASVSLDQITDERD